MTDERLRDLERRWRVQGTVEDEAAYLRELVRVGDLTEERLELAVYLGDQAAAEIVEAGTPRTRTPLTGVKTWVRRLEPWGGLVCLRAAIAATRLLVKDADQPPNEWVLPSLHLAEAYAVEQRTEFVREIQMVRISVQQPSMGRWRACRLCANVVQILKYGGKETAQKARDVIVAVSEDVGTPGPVRAAIQAELIPWALGYSDPVRDRVEARKAASD